MLRRMQDPISAAVHLFFYCMKNSVPREQCYFRNLSFDCASPNFFTKLSETSSSFAVGQKMPTMVLLEPRGLQLYLVSARGHRVYMGT
jgi:hypothetical protein